MPVSDARIPLTDFRVETGAVLLPESEANRSRLLADMSRLKNAGSYAIEKVARAEREVSIDSGFTENPFVPLTIDAWTSIGWPPPLLKTKMGFCNIPDCP